MLPKYYKKYKIQSHVEVELRVYNLELRESFVASNKDDNGDNKMEELGETILKKVYKEKKL